MDIFGISLYIEQYKLKYSNWLKIERGIYTNKDLVVDVLQVIILIGLAGLALLK